MSPQAWSRLRLAGGAVVLGVLVWQLGTGPFLHGLRTVDATALLAGLVLGVATTVCCAWRWRLVVRGAVGRSPCTRPWWPTTARSSSTARLPGGVVGDVHRAVRHGLSPVALERSAGQVVQVALAAVVLLALPDPVRLPFVVLVVALPSRRRRAAALATGRAGLGAGDHRATWLRSSSPPGRQVRTSRRPPAPAGARRAGRHEHPGQRRRLGTARGRRRVGVRRSGSRCRHRSRHRGRVRRDVARRGAARTGGRAPRPTRTEDHRPPAGTGHRRRRTRPCVSGPTPC